MSSPCGQTIIEKPATPRARLPIRRITMPETRRQNQYSFDTSTGIISDDYDSTEDTDSDNDASDDNDPSEITENSFGQSYNSTDYSDIYHAAKNLSKSAGKEKKSFLAVRAFIGIVIVGIGFAISVNRINQEPKANVTNLENILNESIERVQTKFYNQKFSIWNDISSSIYDILLYPETPVVITLFGNETDTMHCLAQLLGQISGKILGSNDCLILTERDFETDVGTVIHNLKQEIQEKKAIIVEDLLNIDSMAIKAFHNFCDKHSPLVGNAIYIITVIVSGYESSQKELKFIEDYLSNSLSEKIEKDILDPLITRLTDGAIIPILSESSTTSCSLPFY